MQTIRNATTGLALSVMVAACSGTSADPDDPFAGRWIDLSHPFDESTIYWPTSRPFELEVLSRDFTDAGYYYATNNFSAAEHGGTHIDAPIHFAEGKRRSPTYCCAASRLGTRERRIP